MSEKEFKLTEKLKVKKKYLISLARKCAKLLKEKYKVKRIFLIGSLVKGIVHERSDIDLVVEGLEPEVYIKALTEVISKKLLQKLKKYLRFPHLFRHIYGFELKWDKIKLLCVEMEIHEGNLKMKLKNF